VKRKDFLIGTTAGMMCCVPLRKSTPSGVFSETKLPQTMVAAPLVHGDTVALVAPASSTWERSEIDVAVAVLESLGFGVLEGAHVRQRQAYLSGSVEERLEDLHRAVTHPEVKAIWCLRGGFGSLHLLPKLNYSLFRRHPKILIGFSDITALLHAVWMKTGLITFHGPVALSVMTPYAVAQIQSLLMSGNAPLPLAQAPEFPVQAGQVDRYNHPVTYRGGQARGHLIGGSLSLMVKLLGTPFEPWFDGAILCLEDVNEEPYRIDGMLSHLALAGKLNRCQGIVLGKFTDCDGGHRTSKSLEDIFLEHLMPLGVPVLRNLMFGHEKDNAVLPIGADVMLDADAQTLTLLSPVVAPPLRPIGPAGVPEPQAFPSMPPSGL
jgi:muramoyltetrapeptide carboxypeptidase